MTSKELERIVLDGESDKVEFKKSTGQLERGMETVCAFLNGDGGTLVFGVDDAGRLVGQLVVDETKQKLGNAIGQISPTADMQIEYVVLGNGQTAIVLGIPPQKENRPFLYKSRAYRRLQTTTSPMPSDMYSELFVERVSGTSAYDYSAQVCSSASMDDLDVEAIETFRGCWIRKSGLSRLGAMSHEQLLRDCGAVRRDGTLTYAALVLFGKPDAIREYLSCSEFVFEYRTTEASGPADERLSFREAFFSAYDRIWERISLRNTKQHYQDGLFVMDVPLFNERVVREALLNAVAHRNYQMPGYVLVRQYPTLLRIESPGGFPSGVSPQNVVDSSAPRNRLIAEILELAGLVERAGQGVNLMYELSVRDAKALPDFSRSDESNVRLDLNGLLLDPALLRMIQNIGERTLVSFGTEDFLVLYNLAMGRRVSGSLLKSIPRLMKLGLVEKIERGHYELSREFYVQRGDPGTHTRRIGLVAEECKELIRKHLRLCDRNGAPATDFDDMLSGTPKRRIRYFLKQMQDSGEIRREGRSVAARWYLVGDKKVTKTI